MNCVIIYLFVVTALEAQKVCGVEWAVTCRPNSLCAFKGSAVDLSCSYTLPSDGLNVTLAYWTKQSHSHPPDIVTNPDYKGRVHADWQKENGRCNLRVNSLAKSDSGAYYCRLTVSAKGQMRTKAAAVYLEVTEAPQIPSLSISSPGKLQEGMNVTLTCTSPSPLRVLSYRWFKSQLQTGTGNADTMAPGHQDHTSARHYKIKHLRREDSGGYYCQTRYACGDRMSSTVDVLVSFAPKNTTLLVSPSGDLIKDEAVTLTCSSDANPPVENYTWFKVHETTPVASGQQFNISNISSEDAGQYYCEARNKLGSSNSSIVLIKDARSDVVSLSLPAVVAVIVGVVVAVLCMLVMPLLHRKCKKDADPPARHDKTVNTKQIRYDARRSALNFSTAHADQVYQNLNQTEDVVYQNM